MLKFFEAFGLSPKNGVGKTTPIRILMEIFPAKRGEVSMIMLNHSVMPRSSGS